MVETPFRPAPLDGDVIDFWVRLEWERWRSIRWSFSGEVSGSGSGRACMFLACSEGDDGVRLGCMCVWARTTW